MRRLEVTEGGRITLPLEFRKMARIRRGDLLEYRVDNGSLVLSNRRKIEHPTKMLFGIASGVSDDLVGDALFIEETRMKLHARRSKTATHA